VAKLPNHQPPPPEPKAAAPSPTAGMGLKEIREMRKAEAEANKAANRERRAKEALIAKLEAEVTSLEQQQKELATQLDDPALYDNPSRAMELNRQLSGVTRALETANAAWIEASEEVASA